MKPARPSYLTSGLWWIPTVLGLILILLASGAGVSKWVCIPALIPWIVCAALACGSIRIR